MDQRVLLMHQAMLGDTVRLRAYDRAFEQTIARGDVVVDVGAGTLILGLLALKHGARHVYAIEGDAETAAMARAIIEHNRLQDRVTLLVGDARDVRLPEPADVLITEMMGNLGPEEEMAQIVAAVAHNNLRPSGRVVPERLITRLQAVQLDAEGWGVWRDDLFGYSFAPVQTMAPSAAQLHFFSRPPRELSRALSISDQTLGAAAPLPTAAHTLEITRPGMLHAIVGFFDALLAPGVTLSNFPSYPGCNWATWLWPLRHTAVSEGDRIRVELRVPDSVRDATSWRLDCAIARRSG